MCPDAADILKTTVLDAGQRLSGRPVYGADVLVVVGTEVTSKTKLRICRHKYVGVDEPLLSIASILIAVNDPRAIEVGSRFDHGRRNWDFQTSWVK